MSNAIELTERELIITPRGLDKLWSFTRRVAVPWAHVRGATHDPGMRDEPKGWRGPGLRVGGKLSGTFHRDGQRHFLNVHGYEDAVVIELTDEPIQRIIVSLADPAAQVARINARAAAD